MEIKKILVTGSNGQLGNELRLLAGNYPFFDFIFTDVAELDICNAGAVSDFVAENSIDAIINCAAFTAVDRAESEEALAYEINAVAPGNLAREIEKRGGVMIQISTDYVFGGDSCVPYTEDCAVKPFSAYGRTKLAAEKAAMEACVNTIVIRTAWLYSSFGHNFVKTMLKLGRERNELGVVYDQIGTPTYARDLARAILEILSSKIVPGVYHFTDEGVASWYDFTIAIHKSAGIETCKVRPLLTSEYPTPATRPHFSVLDKTKIKKTFSLDIPHWMDSLSECVKILEEQNS